MKAEESRKITSANVAMTMLIVLLHTVFDNPALKGVYVLCQMAVPVFFSISAFLYFQQWEFSWSCYKQKVLRRVKSLWVPFVIFNALVVLYYFVKLYLLPIPSERHELPDVLEIVTGCLFGIPEPFNGPLWFVRELMVFVLFAPLLGWVVSRGWKWAVAIVMVSFAVGRYASYFSILYWTPCLVLGCYCALFEVRCLSNKISDKWKWLVVTCFLMFLAFVYFCLQDAADSSLLYYFYRMSAPVWILLLYTVFDNLLPHRLVMSVAPFTFFIFCSHTFFINIVNALVQGICTLPCGVGEAVVFVVAFVMVVLAGRLLSCVKPLWKLLTGFRAK